MIPGKKYTPDLSSIPHTWYECPKMKDNFYCIATGPNYDGGFPWCDFRMRFNICPEGYTR